MLNLLKKDKIKNDEWEKTIDKVKAIYYFIIGGRNGRKSTKIQLKMLKKYFKKKTKFILLRRKVDEIVSKNWFTPYVQNLLKENMTPLFMKNS